MKSMNYIRNVFQQEYTGEDVDMRKYYKSKLIDWRRGNSIERVEKPTNLAAARSKGYKAKKGIFIVRVRLRRGSGTKSRPNMARRPKRMGVNKIKRRKSIQWIAEERAARAYPGLEVLNSYWVGEDGMNKYYEIIMVNPHEPTIMADNNLNWLLREKKRVYRAKTSSARKAKKKRWAGGGIKDRKG